ncbi:hypothetical protein [Nocardiopsis sp. ATB16-24]|uniref:hypothetical protein n=1 Tax=Nocardiopsis sp. ATB16-24 TaxID=3019555 RepID=UPI00255618B5|nr:hypothetical protein [Nocardiopsis sp. ATB16-24]
MYAPGLHRHSTHRAATVAGLFTDAIFGVINATVMLALFSARPESSGYVAQGAVTHVFVAPALLGTTAVMGPPLELGERVRSGDVVTDLLRPVSLLGRRPAQDLGRATFIMVFRGVPVFAVGLFLSDLALPEDPLRWAAFFLPPLSGLLSEGP